MQIDHEIESEHLVTELETLRYNGRRIVSDSIYDRLDESEDDYECSCGATFTEREAAIDHLESAESAVDWDALVYSIDAALPEKASCNLDDQLLVTHGDVRMQLRIYVEGISGGKPSEASISLWDPEADVTASAEDLTFSEAVEIAVGVTRQIGEGCRSFSQLASFVGDDDAAHAFADVELQPSKDW